MANTIQETLGINQNASPDATEQATFFSSLVDPQEISMCTFLARAGVIYSQRQKDLRTKVVNDVLLEKLQQLDAKLEQNAYYSGDNLSADDCTIAVAVLPIVNFVLAPADRSKFNNITAYLSKLLENEAFSKVLGGHANHFAGKARIGRQIDLHANHLEVRHLADTCRQINSSYKKKKTQRQLEKAKKEPVAKQEEAVKAELKFALGDKVPAGASKQEKIDLVGKKLNQLNIEFNTVEHEPAVNMEAMMKAMEGQTGIKCKNLFIKAKKPRNAEDSRLWLIACPNETKVDLKGLRSKLGYPSKGELRMGSAGDLMDNLGCVQGEVTPFALANDPDCKVNMILDASMLKNESEKLWFHPLTNEASVSVSPKDLLRYVTASGREAHVVNFAKLDDPIEMRTEQ